MEKWKQLSPLTRRIIVSVTVFDVALRVSALADLNRRPSEQIRGPKLLWGAGLVLVNSLGLLPIVYFLRGHKPD
ncbi:MAG: DUF5652 family protein [Marmoricola sp.]